MERNFTEIEEMLSQGIEKAIDSCTYDDHALDNLTAFPSNNPRERSIRDKIVAFHTQLKA